MMRDFLEEVANEIHLAGHLIQHVHTWKSSWDEHYSQSVG
jgi:hypothetical protein